MDSWFPTFSRLLHRDIPVPVVWRFAAGEAQRQAVLRLIVLSVEENVPLAPLLLAWAEDERGQQRLRVRKLASLIAGGRPLAEAVEEIPGIAADEDLLAIRFDTQMGTRTAAMRQRLADDAPEAVETKRSGRWAILYLVFIVLIGLLIFGFLQIKIVPVFLRMFQDFGLRLPEILPWSLGITSLLGSLWWLAAIGVVFLLWYCLSREAGRFFRHAVFARWMKPLREAYAADVLAKLAIAAEAGRPIPGALSTLARYHFVPDVRHKLLFVRNEVELGAEVWKSMQAADLIQAADLRVIKTAERTGNRAWVLQELAAVKLQRTRQRLSQASQFVLPAVVLLLAVMVIFQALMIFVPLVRLIEAHL